MLLLLLLLLLLTKGVYPGEKNVIMSTDFQKGHAIQHIESCLWIFLCKTPVNVLAMYYCDCFRHKKHALRPENFIEARVSKLHFPHCSKFSLFPFFLTLPILWLQIDYSLFSKPFFPFL